MGRDLHRDDVVWLVPRTLGAPLICWSQPSAVVDYVSDLYVGVLVQGQQYRVHRDNVTRTDPGRERAVPRPRSSRRQMVLPPGWVEQPLFTDETFSQSHGMVERHKTITVDDEGAAA